MLVIKFTLRAEIRKIAENSKERKIRILIGEWTPSGCLITYLFHKNSDYRLFFQIFFKKESPIFA